MQIPLSRRRHVAPTTCPHVHVGLGVLISPTACRSCGTQSTLHLYLHSLTHAVGAQLSYPVLLDAQRSSVSQFGSPSQHARHRSRTDNIHLRLIDGLDEACQDLNRGTCRERHRSLLTCLRKITRTGLDRRSFEPDGKIAKCSSRCLDREMFQHETKTGLYPCSVYPGP